MRPADSFVQQPIRSLQTMLRVIAEDDGTLPTLVPDGIYGIETMDAITALQRKQGLPTTGITDQRTWETVVSIYENATIRVSKAEPIEIIMDPGKVYRAGESSANIYLMQSMLTQLALDHPTVSAPNHTGILDDPSQEALRSFQTMAGLPPTGELDRITWKNLSRQFTLSAHHHESEHRQA